MFLSIQQVGHRDMRNEGVATKTTGGSDQVHGLSTKALRCLDRAILKAIDRVMRQYGIGALQLILPSMASAVVGDQSKLLAPKLTLYSYRALWAIARRGALGFAEAYMDGHIDTADLRAVFAFYLANEQALVRARPRFNDTRGQDRRFHNRRRNSIAGSRRNIADHYDLGNDFYGLWLDPSLLYSSGIFREATQSLEDAQLTKLDAVLAALELAPKHALLEIGCGWGAMAEAAANAGAHVRAITISEQQLRATRHRLSLAGVSECSEVCFEDYRRTTGTFDRIVSIEMIEAVGEENWSTYFETLSDRLAPGGVAVIQAITIRSDAFEHYRNNPDFIQRYIFPGGMLPTIEIMQQFAEQSGLTFERVEQFGQSYALTLAEWRMRFLAAWPHISDLGFNERFRRMWLYYLDYCEVGFESGWVDVGIYRMRKPQKSAHRSCAEGAIFDAK